MFVIMIAMLACACSDGQQPEPPLLPTTELTVSSDTVTERLTVELATTAPQRSQGLMYRKSMAEDRGMLFVFPDDIPNGFWMKNTYIPLDIAYVDADGTILQIVQGQPLDETILRPDEPYRFALEVNQGWFERHNLGVGDKVESEGWVPATDAAAAAAPAAGAAP
jgi:uncharacterized membrane protein (UPF0127 family)